MKFYADFEPRMETTYNNNNEKVKMSRFLNPIPISPSPQSDFLFLGGQKFAISSAFFTLKIYTHLKMRAIYICQLVSDL